MQAGVNIGFSAVQLGYLVFYLPYKERHIFVSAISGEIAASVFICMSTFYLESISLGDSGIVEAVMIYSILGAISIQFFCVCVCYGPII